MQSVYRKTMSTLAIIHVRALIKPKCMTIYRLNQFFSGLSTTASGHAAHNDHQHYIYYPTTFFIPTKTIQSHESHAAPDEWNKTTGHNYFSWWYYTTPKWIHAFSFKTQAAQNNIDCHILLLFARISHRNGNLFVAEQSPDKQANDIRKTALIKKSSSV